MEPRPVTAEPSNKRPRSPGGDHPQAHQSKMPKTHSNHLQINYLARQYPDNLPLVAPDDTMPAIIHLIGEYDGVLHRHESIAGNLGACPLGPILIKRFERLFDGPPRVLKSHGKDGPTVTWLDVVEFAKNKPEQFNLEKSRNGVRVCQFYTKQCRVEISEEDFVLIASGMPQKMIPPQPIIEDEEKELGALEILEKNLQQIIQMADQVSARARQLSYRLKNRRTAIVSRRENDASLNAQTRAAAADVWREMKTTGPTNGQSAASPSGFVAVNANRAEGESEEAPLPSQFMFSHSNTENITIINGTSIKGASPTTRADLMKKFFTTADRQARGYDEVTGTTNPIQPRPRPQASDPADHSIWNSTNNGCASGGNDTGTAPGSGNNTSNNILNNSTTPVAIPGTPSSLLPPPKTTPQEKDDGGPYKLEMVARMEELQRGERVNPPCDRCRRLHMDCLKNLTACMGCTKKHAKCSWRDVKEDEIRAPWGPSALREPREIRESHERMEDDRLPPLNLPGLVPSQGAPISAERERYGRLDRPARLSETPSDPQYSQHNRHESAPGAPHFSPGSGASMGLPASERSPRRAVSETEGGGRGPQHGPPPPRHAEDDDPDANQRLMQAILDTVDHHARVAAAVQEKERGAERAGESQSNPHKERDVERERKRERERERERERDRDRDRDHERRMVQA
ncbi:C6 finger domain protein [Penicillium brasilianum]|uniref:C6 finger domain protein n=1 Tax=Penicillium brasilianum TaxID=104259 RepID=A0A1S9RXZ1_PENBI|nr:C6 finger domain protein [Penicillium brasilianum]